MKLYKYTCGDDTKVGVAKDEKDAYERRGEVDPTFSFLPVQIEEYEIPGYEIVIRPVVEAEEPFDIEAADATQLRKFLRERGIQFFNGAKADELRALAREAITHAG